VTSVSRIIITSIAAVQLFEFMDFGLVLDLDLYHEDM